MNLILQSFCEQQDLFVIYQSLIYAVCLTKSNSKEKGVRKKGRVKQTTVFESVPALLCLLCLKKKKKGTDQRTGSVMSFESCLASATWWVAFVLLEQHSVLFTIWTLIITHLSNLLLWKELGWRSACNIAAVEAKRCALLFAEVVVSSPSLMLLIHLSGLNKCWMLFSCFALCHAHKKC